MEDKKRITDRYTDNANDFDKIVVDTFKIIEGKDETIHHLAAVIKSMIPLTVCDEHLKDQWEKIASKYLD